MTDARTPADHHQDTYVMQVLLTEDDLYAIDEALSLLANDLWQRRELFLDAEQRGDISEEIDRCISLSTRISGRIDDLIIAQGGDPT